MVRHGRKSAGLIARNSMSSEQVSTILLAPPQDASSITGVLVASDGG